MVYKKTKALTLVEILIVVSIISIIGVSIFSVLKSGIEIWHRATVVNKEEDIRIFLEKLTSDLNNICFFSDANIKAESQFFSFPAVVNSPFRSGLNSYADQIVQVKYKFISYKNTVIRELSHLSSRGVGYSFYEKPVLDDVVLFRFEFLYRDQNNEMVSKKFPEKDMIPAYVKLTLTYDLDGTSRKEVSQLIEVPIANKVEG